MPQVELIEGERLCDWMQQDRLRVKVQEGIEYGVIMDEPFFSCFSEM